jgi:hypothetical protein
LAGSFSKFDEARREGAEVTSGVSTMSSDGPCTYYMAPSTIENSGFGVFAGVPFAEGDIFGYGDFAIPILISTSMPRDHEQMKTIIGYLMNTLGVQA